MTNVDAREVSRFGDLAARWWDADGDLKTLHDINPVRTEFVAARWPLDGACVLDVGCGGGLLSEALAARGAVVTGIDASERAVEIAKLHLYESGQRVDYHCETAEAHAIANAGRYDLVTCMELLEHVPEPSSVIAACAALLRPGGAACFSTLNRTPASFALAIVGAEYVLDLVPRGTHEWSRFIRPSELDAMVRDAGLHTMEFAGLHYEPFSRTARVGGGIAVNYMAWCSR
ncbi:MAG: bifunctional 2-polyprenyl-6-hydroxyphenol methylase/3-demethylubiquinol 3-O-methyltransferase UbiG [Gammaproteobacteria bacterium]